MLSMILILTGCASKSNFSLSFDNFSFVFYDNDKEYVNQAVDTSTAGIKTLIERKVKLEDTTATWFIGSLIVIKTLAQSWINIKALIDSNTENLKVKLSEYRSLSTVKQKIKCNKVQYSWYITTFSYQLDRQKIYAGQYFFVDNGLVYVISLNTTDKKDNKQFVRSIKTLQCMQ